MNTGKDKAPMFSETLEHFSWVSPLAFSQTQNKGYKNGLQPIFIGLAKSDLSLCFTSISGV
jgi:hypothetical protein